MRLAFWAASAHCRVIFSFSSTNSPTSFSAGLLSIHSSPSLYLCYIYMCVCVCIYISPGRYVHQCWLLGINLAGKYQLLAIPVFWVRNPTRTGSVPLWLYKRDSSQHILQPCTRIVRHPEQRFFIIIQSLMSYNRKVVGVVRLSSWAFTTIFKSFALTKLFPISVSAVRLRVLSVQGARSFSPAERYFTSLRACRRDCDGPSTERMSQKEICTVLRFWKGTQCIRHPTLTKRQWDTVHIVLPSQCEISGKTASTWQLYWLNW